MGHALSKLRRKRRSRRSRSASTTSLRHIPLPILQSVVDHLSATSQTTTLAALCRVNKECHEVAVPVLYRRVSLMMYDKKKKKSPSLLRTSPKYLWFIKHLTIGSPSILDQALVTSLLIFLSSCESLETLTHTSPFTWPLLHPFPFPVTLSFPHLHTLTLPLRIYQSAPFDRPRHYFGHYSNQSPESFRFSTLPMLKPPGEQAIKHVKIRYINEGWAATPLPQQTAWEGVESVEVDCMLSEMWGAVGVVKHMFVGLKSLKVVGTFWYTISGTWPFLTEAPLINPTPTLHLLLLLLPPNGSPSSSLSLISSASSTSATRLGLDFAGWFDRSPELMKITVELALSLDGEREAGEGVVTFTAVRGSGACSCDGCAEAGEGGGRKVKMVIWSRKDLPDMEDGGEIGKWVGCEGVPEEVWGGVWAKGEGRGSIGRKVIWDEGEVVEQNQGV